MIYNEENASQLVTVYWSTRCGRTVVVKRAARDTHIQPDISELMEQGYTINDVDRLIREWHPLVKETG